GSGPGRRRWSRGCTGRTPNGSPASTAAAKRCGCRRCRTGCFRRRGGAADRVSVLSVRHSPPGGLLHRARAGCCVCCRRVGGRVAPVGSGRSCARPGVGAEPGVPARVEDAAEAVPLSVVTNLLLSFSVLEDEDERMVEVNAFPWLL